MPLFEYHCETCHAEVEILVRANEQALCPKCGGDRLTKRLSVPAAPVSRGSGLPLATSCGDPSLPPCGPGCRRMQA